MALFYYKEKKNKGIRAAAYLRLSIEDGDKAESNSIGNQRELIQNFVAERPELHLVGEYADDGYTGTNFERPGFTQMMEDIQSDKINCIIVKDLSRLGRNYIEMGKYLERIFPMMGIRFIAINDNYDNANTESSDSDSIVVPFKNLLNDSYCRDISIKARSQLDIKRRKGEFIGGYAVYGYSKDEQNKNRLVVDEYAADDYKQTSPIFWCREGQELIGQTKCSSEIFQANDIENAVFQALKKELSLLGSLYGDIKKEEQSLKEASRKASRRKTSMEQELKNLKGEKMRMYEEYAAGTLSLDNYKNKKQEYDRKIAEVQDKIEQSRAEEAAQSVVPGTVRAAAEQAENFLHGTRLTASMVSAFIENVYVHEGGRIVVQFKYEQSIQDAVRALHTD